jgi:hypothetical protein
MVPAILAFERQGEVLGTLNSAEPAKSNKDWADAKGYGESLMRKCFQWDLEFSSAGKFIDGSDGYDSSVSAKVPIRVEAGGTVVDVTLTGKSALLNESFTFRVKVDNCDLTNYRGGGEFKVDALTWDTLMKADPDGTPRYYVKDFKLSYFPGNTSEYFIMQCWNPDPPHEKYPPFNYPPTGMWTATYVMTHYKESASGAEGGQPPQAISLDDLMAGAAPSGTKAQSFLAQNWKVNAAEIMGNKVWQGPSDLDSSVIEGGEFKLVHKPQR